MSGPAPWVAALHGLLFGSLVGSLAGGAEYLALWLQQAFGRDLAKPYWDIVLPYALVGALAGLVVAGVLRLLSRGHVPLGGFVARVLSVLLASITFAYLVIGATYRLGPPVLKLSNLLAYLASAVVAIAVGWGVTRSLGAVFSRLDGRGRSAARTSRLISAAIAALVAAVLLLPPLLVERTGLGATAGRGDGRGTPHPNIVFILIDALRADHLPVYGYSRNTAPHLTELARGGATFTRMYAQSASTRPSVATIFSSLYPAVHKVHHERDFLSDSVPVLAEVLRTAGYRTFAASANVNVSPTFGYAQGFDEFWVFKTESAFRLTTMGSFGEDLLGTTTLSRLLGERREVVPTADTVTDITLAWAARNRSGPTFMYVHYIDPHDPYRPPPPFDKAFDHRRDPPTRSGRVEPTARLRKASDRDRIAHTLDQYDGEILFADREVRRLLEGLRELGVLDNTLVVVTADHGEEFLDHGQEGHGRSTYDEVLRVPFILSWKDRVPRGSVHHGMVGLIDVMPTLLELVGVPAPPGVQGISFVPSIREPGRDPTERRLFAQVVANSFSLEMARDDRYKLVRHTSGPHQGREELYDLAEDPLEQRDLAPQGSLPVAAALRGELAAFNRVASRAAEHVRSEKVQNLDRHTERALRSLGYIK